MPISSQARAITVFCGASSGSDPRFAIAAFGSGQLIAKAGYALVYGGAGAGLMGEVADGALAGGGQVIGVLPPVADYEQRHPGLTWAIDTTSLSQRKAIMLERASAFVVLPGGLGTLDELFEVMVLNETFRTLTKPLFVLNIAGYFDLLLAWRRHAETAGFIKRQGLSPCVLDDWRGLADALAELRGASRHVDSEARDVAQWEMGQ